MSASGFRHLFAQDKELHHRLARHVELSRTESGGSIDSWLVAKHLAQRCIERHERKQHRFRGQMPTFHFQPALCQIHFAMALDASGKFRGSKLGLDNGSKKNWRRFAAKEITLGDGTKLRFQDFSDPDKRACRAIDVKKGGGLFSIRSTMDYFRNRVALEQTVQLREFRRLSFEARQLNQRGAPQKALSRLQIAFPVTCPVAFQSARSCKFAASIRRQLGAWLSVCRPPSIRVQQSGKGISKISKGFGPAD